MKSKAGKWVDRLRNALKHTQVGAGKPLVEIWGNNRVLIENHNCVLGYSPEQIRIKVSYGTLCVTGNKLLFAKLSAEQLVITGCVESVRLTGGCTG